MRRVYDLSVEERNRMEEAFSNVRNKLQERNKLRERNTGGAEDQAPVGNGTVIRHQPY